MVTTDLGKYKECTTRRSVDLNGYTSGPILRKEQFKIEQPQKDNRIGIG